MTTDDSTAYVTWKAVIEVDTAPAVQDMDGHPIATVHGSERVAISRAGLIAATPALLDATIGALEVFRAIAQHAEGPASLAAQDMIPVAGVGPGVCELAWAGDDGNAQRSVARPPTANAGM